MGSFDVSAAGAVTTAGAESGGLRSTARTLAFDFTGTGGGLDAGAAALGIGLPVGHPFALQSAAVATASEGGGHFHRSSHPPDLRNRSQSFVLASLAAVADAAASGRGGSFADGASAHHLHTSLARSQQQQIAPLPLGDQGHGSDGDDTHLLHRHHRQLVVGSGYDGAFDDEGAVDALVSGGLLRGAGGGGAARTMGGGGEAGGVALTSSESLEASVGLAASALGRLLESSDSESGGGGLRAGGAGGSDGVHAFVGFGAGVGGGGAQHTGRRHSSSSLGPASLFSDSAGGFAGPQAQLFAASDGIGSSSSAAAASPHQPPHPSHHHQGAAAASSADWASLLRGGAGGGHAFSPQQQQQPHPLLRQLLHSSDGGGGANGAADAGASAGGGLVINSAALAALQLQLQLQPSGLSGGGFTPPRGQHVLLPHSLSGGTPLQSPAQRSAGATLLGGGSDGGGGGEDGDVVGGTGLLAGGFGALPASGTRALRHPPTMPALPGSLLADGEK